MRAEPPVDVAAGGVDQMEVVRVEEAVLDARIPVVGDRSANARERLPGEPGVGIVEEAGAIVGDRQVALDPRDAGAAADEALEAVVVAEIEQRVDHERQRVGVAGDEVILTGAARKRGRGADRGDRARAHGQEIGIGLAVAGLGFEAEAAEVVTDDAAEVVAGLVIDADRVVGAADIEVGVFEDHRTPVELDIPRVIASHRRRSQRSRRHGQAYD